MKQALFLKVAGHHSSGGKEIGEKGPANEPEPVAYAVMWSFSYASYGIGHVPLSSIVHYVPDTGVQPTTTTEDPCPQGWYLCNVMVVGLSR